MTLGSISLVVRSLEDANRLAHAIVNSIPEPFVVLNADLRVLEANLSFYQSFKVNPAETVGSLLYNLGNDQWDIPALRVLLETILLETTAMDNFEVEHDFEDIGRKTMLLNARKVTYDDAGTMAILLAFRDITERRAIDQEKEVLLQRSEELRKQNDVLLEEMRHRVGNSLQIIASILLIKAKAVSSQETRFHLEDARQRVMSVATVQQYLHMTDGIEQVGVRGYLEKLCEGLASSMISDGRPIKLDVVCDTGMIASAHAVSLGLIVTELVINALKYAFPVGKQNAIVTVGYEISATGWRLTVSDNGVGKADKIPTTGGGLGTTIVDALAQQLGAKVGIVSSPAGLKIDITHATFAPQLPKAA
jgi:two-component sensor histidine kinase